MRWIMQHRRVSNVAQYEFYIRQDNIPLRSMNWPPTLNVDRRYYIDRLEMCCYFQIQNPVVHPPTSAYLSSGLSRGADLPPLCYPFELLWEENMIGVVPKPPQLLSTWHLTLHRCVRFAKDMSRVLFMMYNFVPNTFKNVYQLIIRPFWYLKITIFLHDLWDSPNLCKGLDVRSVGVTTSKVNLH